MLFRSCKRLGAWEQGVILSDASQLEPEVQPTEVKELDATKRFPWWVIPIAFAILVSFLSALGGILFIILQRDVDKLGPVDEGQEKYEYEDSFTEKVDMGLFKGVEQAFDVFIMRPNIAAAEWPPLEKTDKWDKNLMEWVTRSEQIHGRGWKFWEQLDNAAEDYATVLVELREAGLPDVLARLQAWLLERMPGEPLLSVDNLDSLRVDNVAPEGWQIAPELGIANLTPLEQQAVYYVRHGHPRTHFDAFRARARR